MTGIDKINNDFVSLFREGRSWMEAGCGPEVNAFREDAFGKFLALGGIPFKTEDYLYMDLLPVFGKDYKVVLKYIPQDRCKCERSFSLCRSGACYGFVADC